MVSVLFAHSSELLGFLIGCRCIPRLRLARCTHPIQPLFNIIQQSARRAMMAVLPAGR